ncbi:MAG: hypothetical protein JWR15_4555 [Prosthecobacter sp.]|nr:hypothetical protein [Prosthecobacter sp.]
MKKEAHLKAWLLAALALEVFTVICAPYTFILYKLGYPVYPVAVFLTYDVGFGLCLLPVIATAQRGDGTEKVVARALAVLPLVYMYLKIALDLPNCLQLLSEL